MQDYEDNIFARGLTFFGRTNRLISHELKNVLAIIFETTSLLDELVELSEEGTRLEPGKLRSLARSILEDIDRGNEIVRSMNTFAHGVDSLYGEADIGQTARVMANISRMNAAAKKTRLEISDPEAHTIFTIPFLLQNLLYHAITGTMAGVGAESEVRMALSAEDDGVCIRLEGTNPEFGQTFVRDQAPFFQSALAATISFDPAAKVMLIRLPNRIEKATDNKGL